MVATARVCPRAPGLLLLQTSTRWERLQDVEPALLLPAWLLPEVSCRTVHPGVVLARPPPPKEDAEEDEEALKLPAGLPPAPAPAAAPKLGKGGISI
jgi:hypothetical protein